MPRLMSFGASTTDAPTFGVNPLAAGTVMGRVVEGWQVDAPATFNLTALGIVFGSGANQVADLNCIDIQSLTPRIRPARCEDF